MTNNNQVNWDEIPEDVEAVVTFSELQPTYLKFVNNSLYQQGHRDNKYMHSSLDWDALMEEFGDRFHLRPSPTPEPTPEPPESTQVETSEVEATTTPEFDWSSVEDDVEAVFLHKSGKYTWCQYYKTVDGKLMVSHRHDDHYYQSSFSDIQERSIGSGATDIFIRPPSISTILQEAQQSILKHHGITGKVELTVTCKYR